VLEANREAEAVVSTGFGRVFLITASRNLLLIYLCACVAFAISSECRSVCVALVAGAGRRCTYTVCTYLPVFVCLFGRRYGIPVQRRAAVLEYCTHGTNMYNDDPHGKQVGWLATSATPRSFLRSEEMMKGRTPHTPTEVHTVYAQRRPAPATRALVEYLHAHYPEATNSLPVSRGPWVGILVTLSNFPLSLW